METYIAMQIDFGTEPSLDALRQLSHIPCDGFFFLRARAAPRPVKQLTRHDNLVDTEVNDCFSIY